MMITITTTNFSNDDNNKGLPQNKNKKLHLGVSYGQNIAVKHYLYGRGVLSSARNGIGYKYNAQETPTRT